MPFKVGQHLRLDHVINKNVQICATVTVTTIKMKNNSLEYHFTIDNLYGIENYLEEHNIIELPTIINKGTKNWCLTNSSTFKAKSKFCHF